MFASFIYFYLLNIILLLIFYTKPVHFILSEEATKANLHKNSYINNSLYVLNTLLFIFFVNI